MLRILASSAIRRSAAAGVQMEARAAYAGAAGAGKKPAKKDDDLDTFELLPPGCSIADPSYGMSSMSDPVLIYDETTVEDYRPIRRLRRNVEPPTSRAAAQAQLDAKKAADAAAKEEEDDDNEPYVYLPPGSSMREPGYNSLSDPLDRALGRHVYYRDPSPILRKK